MRGFPMLGLIITMQLALAAISSASTLAQDVASKGIVGLPSIVMTSDSAGCAADGGAAQTDAATIRSTAVARRPTSTPASATGRFSPRWNPASEPVRVLVEQDTSVAGWKYAYREELAAAFDAWTAAGSAVTFAFINDTSSARVHIHWVEKLDSQHDGWTTIRWNSDGWIVSADMILSVTDGQGRTLSRAARDQVMLHEIGHLLGLAHSSSASSIMRGEVRSTTISAADRDALSSLYGPSDRAAFARGEAVQRDSAARCGGTSGRAGK